MTEKIIPKFLIRRVILVLALAATMLPLAARQASAYPGVNVSLEGRGYGHGRGMGQWGALGYALNHNWNHQQILGHFYGGTAEGNIGNPVMSVRLTKFDGVATTVQQERGHMTTDAGPGAFRALRATHIGGNKFKVEHGPGCGGPWTLLNPGDTGPVKFWQQFPSEDRASMLQVCEPGGPTRWLRGSIEALLDSSTQRTINLLGLDDYLRGVVPRESPASWGSQGGGKGMNALRAQAVAARSYAWAENRYPYAKTCDTTACQVYGGRAYQDGGGYKDLEQANTNTAVAETGGQVRIKNGQAARTEFSSSTGGHTAGGTFPAVPDAGDSIAGNGNHDWDTTIPVSSIETHWPEIGTLLDIRITARNGLGGWGGRVTQMVLQGTEGAATISGGVFRSRLGLKSDWFNLLSLWEGLGGYSAGGVDAASPGLNRVHVFIRGGDGALWQRSWNGSGWSAWRTLGGVIVGDPTAVSAAPGTLDVLARGTDQALWRIHWNGKSWSGWSTLGGILKSSPDATSWDEGRIDVFALGADGGLWQVTYSGAWHGWYNIGGSFTSGPAAAAWGPGRIDVLGRGADGALWRTTYSGGWSVWGSLGGYLTSGPDAVSWGVGRIDVFVVGGDGAVWQKIFNKSWSAWATLGAPVTSAGSGARSDPSASSWAKGRLDLFAVARDGSVVHRYYQQEWGGWGP